MSKATLLYWTALEVLISSGSRHVYERSIFIRSVDARLVDRLSRGLIDCAASSETIARDRVLFLWTLVTNVCCHFLNNYRRTVIANNCGRLGYMRLKPSFRSSCQATIEPSLVHCPTAQNPSCSFGLVLV